MKYSATTPKAGIKSRYFLFDGEYLLSINIILSVLALISLGYYIYSMKIFIDAYSFVSLLQKDVIKL